MGPKSPKNGTAAPLGVEEHGTAIEEWEREIERECDLTS
jgi:hypothetical protein